MVNRLAQEKSPYLQQHKDNPVDWYPWGAEALEKAKAENRPIFLSIGYSACHWCHVMEHESFENEDIADQLNRLFVPIKVDREERPDIDSLYMGAVQALTGQGGWPLNVFLTPGLKPFYGGTYWPPEERMGLPGFPKVLEAVSDAYTNKRDGVEENADQVGNFLEKANRGAPDRGVLSSEILDQAFAQIKPAFDEIHGGFGNAPKFPQSPLLEFMLRTLKRTGADDADEIVRVTFDNMMQGGMYDQIGGGFHRYAVDREWIVPHFEKMLYDNAQLARNYLDAFRLTREPRYGQMAADSLDYLLSTVVEGGGLYSAEDADTEGEEGRFYVWDLDEARAVLQDAGCNAELVLRAFGISQGGNFEGRSIPTRQISAEALARQFDIDVAEAEDQIRTGREALRTARNARTNPGQDLKLNASWNGMALRALAEGSVVLENPDYLNTANGIARYWQTSSNDWTDLRHVVTEGKNGVAGYLEDYANLADGLLALYQVTGDLQWFDGSKSLIDVMLDLFTEPDNGLLFDSQIAHEPLITRVRDIQDGPTPAGNSVAAEVLIKLARMTGNRAYEERAEAILAPLARPMAEQPQGFGRALAALDLYLSTPKEVAIAGPPGADPTRAMTAAVMKTYEPAVVVGYADPDHSQIASRLPFLEARPMRDNNVTGYLCERYACLPPTTDPMRLQELLEQGTGVAWSEF